MCLTRPFSLIERHACTSVLFEIVSCSCLSLFEISVYNRKIETLSAFIMIDSWTGAIHVVSTTVYNFQCVDFSHHDRILFGVIGNCQESSGYPVEFRNFGLPIICLLFF